MITYVSHLIPKSGIIASISCLSEEGERERCLLRLVITSRAAWVVARSLCGIALVLLGKRGLKIYVLCSSGRRSAGLRLMGEVRRGWKLGL